MKFNGMYWVHRLLVVCISFKFTGLSSSAIKNITETSQLNQDRTKRLDSEYITETSQLNQDRTKRLDSEYTTETSQVRTKRQEPEYITNTSQVRTKRLDPEYITDTSQVRTKRLDPEYITYTSQVRTNRLDPEYVDSRDAFTSNDAVNNGKSKRSINSDLDDDVGAEDIMNVAIYNKSPDGDTEREGTNEKRSSLECEEHTMECPAIRRNLGNPPYAIDFSIGNEIPITMEHSNELPSASTLPEDIFDEQGGANIMIQNETPVAKEHVSKLTADASLPKDTRDEWHTANIMIQNEQHNKLTASASSPADIADEQPRTQNYYTGYSTIPSVDNTTTGVSREKRDSILTDNTDYAFVSPEISAMIRNKNDNQVTGDFDFDSPHEEDLMETMADKSTASIDTDQILHQVDTPVTEEHISILTAKATSPKKEVHIGHNYNTLKKELIAEVEMMKNVSHIKKHKHQHSHKHSHKKHIKQTPSKSDQISQRLPPIANHKRSELTARSSSPRDEIKRGRSSRASKRSRTENTNGELRSIFTEMRSAKHKLTRNDIRKLAKTAVMLAALKSQGHFEPVRAEKRHSISKPKHNKSPRKKKASKSKKKTKKSKSHTKKVDKSESMNAVRTDTASDEMSFNTKDLSNQPEFTVNHNYDKEDINGNIAKHEKVAKQVDITVEQPTNGRTEFSEDMTKKTKNVGVSDDAMRNLVSKNTADEERKQTTTPAPTTPKSNPLIETISELGASMTTTTIPTTVSSTRNMLPTTPVTTTIDGAADLSKELALKVITDGNIIQKKSEVTRPEDEIEKAISDYDTNDLFTMIDSPEKKSMVPSREVSDSMASLKSVLSKVSPNKVPGNFLPDIPAGLRMIAWKKLLEKKRSQLAEYESVVGVSEATTGADKPVTLNIALDGQKSPSDDATSYAKIGSEEKDSFAKKSPADQTDQIKELESEQSSNFMTDGGHDDNLETARHVHYLKKHIAGARSLRKLIAKTLVGHCKSTGKRILAAFIAMDKALERAQAIATVIGGKFNVDPNKIENLVSDKEDQVVETFLRDIFTKL